MTSRIYCCVQGTVGAEIQSCFRRLDYHRHKRPLVRRDHQAGLERVCATSPPVNQLASVKTEIAAVGETSVAAADYEQTAVTAWVLVAARVDPSGHRHSVGIKVQGRYSHPCGSR